jgi:1-acyl-sn-glycerol-3-phosphate acyltransferase
LSLRRIPRVGYEYLALWFGLGLLGAISLSWTLLAVPLHYLLPKRLAAPLGRFVIHAVFRFYLWALSAIGACRFDLRELDRLRDAGPLIIAPNHPCLLDAFFVLSRLPNVACIMKASIVDNVFLGAGARLAGYIRNDAPLAMILRASDELKRGSPLLVFPEGTRTTRWPVNDFTPATALIARRARAPVQTVFIETDSAYLGKGWPLFRRPDMPIHYRARLGRRFDAPRDHEALTRELQAYFAEQVKLDPSARLPSAAAAAAPHSAG